MSVTLILILVLAAVCLVAGLVIYILAQSAAQAGRDRDTLKAQADRYLKELASSNAESARRQKLIDEIMEADRESDERKAKIEAAGPDPRKRFDASLGVLSDIANAGTGKT